MPLALCLTEAFLSGKDAAWRLHGGGFAGTIQVFIPTDLSDSDKHYIETFFGEGACHIASIRQAGAVCLYREEA